MSWYLFGYLCSLFFGKSKRNTVQSLVCNPQACTVNVKSFVGPFHFALGMTYFRHALDDQERTTVMTVSSVFCYDCDNNSLIKWTFGAKFMVINGTKTLLAKIIPFYCFSPQFTQSLENLPVCTMVLTLCDSAVLSMGHARCVRACIFTLYVGHSFCVGNLVI